jgi:hypothetical protein
MMRILLLMSSCIPLFTVTADPIVMQFGTYRIDVRNDIMHPAAGFCSGHFCGVVSGESRGDSVDLVSDAIKQLLLTIQSGTHFNQICTKIVRRLSHSELEDSSVAVAFMHRNTLYCMEYGSKAAVMRIQGKYAWFPLNEYKTAVINPHKIKIATISCVPGDIYVCATKNIVYYKKDVSRLASHYLKTKNEYPESAAGRIILYAAYKSVMAYPLSIDRAKQLSPSAPEEKAAQEAYGYYVNSAVAILHRVK